MDWGIEKTIAMSTDGIIKPKQNSLGGYDYEVVVGGQTLLTSINGEWHYGLTPAEQHKKDEFNKIYWSFVDQAKNELKTYQTSKNNSFFVSLPFFNAFLQNMVNIIIYVYIAVLKYLKIN